MSTAPEQRNEPTLFGHPTGLFMLFFAEMWERFSYYGMRSLLLFYMIKKLFVGQGDSNAYAIYGAYTALVYMTPFFGGMIADRFIGARRAVVLGGLLMAAGHLLMAKEDTVYFFLALALLIAGNGFFKPNISTIVGALYPKTHAGLQERDAGFTIFYMGINLGAAMSPLLCGYIGETYGWHYGFGLATIGMLIGLVVFVNWIPPGDQGAPPDRTLLRRCPVVVSQFLLASGALAGAIGLFVYHPDNPFSTTVNVFVGIALLVAGGVGCLALRGDRGGFINVEWTIYGGTLLSVPVFALLVSGFSPFTDDGKAVTLIPDSWIKEMRSGEVMHQQLGALRKAVEKKSDAERMRELTDGFQALHKQKALRDDQLAGLSEATPLVTAQDWEGATAKIDELSGRFSKGRFRAVAGMILQETSKPAGLILLLAGIAAFTYLGIETFRLETVARQRMFVVLILTFFSMLFWAFFEQAGSSVNNFTDRNVDRVFEQRVVTSDDVGKTIRIQPTQEQLGYRNGDRLFTIDQLDRLREEHSEKNEPDFEIDWTVAAENVGMGIADRKKEVPASVFQSINPIYIMIFGLVFTWIWTFLRSKGYEPSTPLKFSLGLLQLALGFGALWLGAQSSDDRGMVALSWLFLGYLLQTTGELCLSPVGLSMVTKLSPAVLVSTVMGVWFLATAFSQFLAAIIAQFTGVTHGGGGGNVIPIPKETVHVYGDVFGTIAITAMVAAGICFALVPMLKRWMHEEVVEESERPASQSDVTDSTSDSGDETDSGSRQEDDGDSSG